MDPSLLPASSTSSHPTVPIQSTTLPSCQVWLRHGEKTHANGKGITGYSHDPELTSLGSQQIYQQTLHLLSMFVPPQQITCSPFLRCRQSAVVMKNVIAEVTRVVVPIVVDRWLGEYLGNHPHLQLDGAVAPQTLQAKPVVHETLRSFKKRRMPNIIKHNSYNNCWYITHGIVVDHLITHWSGEDSTTKYQGQHGNTTTGSGFALVASVPSNNKIDYTVVTLEQVNVKQYHG